jgi:hypothetical protein
MYYNDCIVVQTDGGNNGWRLMAVVLTLELTESTEEELAHHRLRLVDALAILDEDDYRTFPDPKSPGRRYMIGRDHGARLLTLVIEPADDPGKCLLITGWPSNKAETTLYSRSGGSKYAGTKAKATK